MNFWLQILSFLVLDKILDKDKFESTDFKYESYFLKLQLKTPKLRNFYICTKLRVLKSSRLLQM